MKAGKDKRISLQDAVAQYCPDGCSFTFGGLGARDPYAVAFEMIRQKKKDLTYVVASGMDLANLMIGAGIIGKVESSYIWIGSVGSSGLNYRRAVEKGIPRKIEVEEYSNYTMALRYLAAAMNVPYMPTRSLLGSDIPTYNDKIKIVKDYYSDDTLAIVPAVKLDTAFIHVQRADILGNGQIWGVTVNDQNAARAAKHVVLTCEEIVPTSEIRQLSNMTAIPSYCVDAVIQVPFCSHPLWTAGYYWCDMPFRRNFAMANGTQEGLDKWIQEWIIDTKDWDGYLEKVGKDRLEKLAKMETDNYTIPKLQ